MKGTIMSQFEDGRLLLHDKGKIKLVNNKSGETIWENKISTKASPEFLFDLPILFFEGSPFKVLDARTGYVIDQSLEKTTVMGISYFLEQGYAVLELKRNKQLHILNVNLKNPSLSWITAVGPVKKSSLDKLARLSENPPVLTKNGSLIAMDKNYIAVLDTDGSIKHEFEFIEKIRFYGYNEEKSILYVTEGKKKLHFIDISIGKPNSYTTIKSDDLIFNVLGNGHTVCLAQDNVIKVLDATNASPISEHAFEDKVKATYVDEHSKRLYVLTKKTIAEVDTTSGLIVNSASYLASLSDIYSVFGKTIVSGPSGASPINLNTLEFDYPTIPKIPRVYDYVEFGNYTGFVFYKEDKFKLHVVDQNGDVVWKKSYYPTFIPSLDVIGDGLLIVSESEVSYVTFDYGEPIWSDKIKVDPSFVYAVDEDNNDLYMYANKRLYKFNYSNGALSKSQSKFKFKDFDYEFLQPQIFVLDDAIFLKGSNTVFILNKDGTLKHEKTYKRISTGSTILELATVVVTAVAIGTGNASEVSTFYADGYYQQGGLVDAIDISLGIADQMKYERRLKQNRNSNFYPYVFTKLENGKRGFIFIEPSTGEERFYIEIDKKNPFYIVDDVSGIFYHLDEELLTAYSIK